MKILINGKERIIEHESLSIATLLKEEKVESPDMVSVQLNGSFIDKGTFENVYVKDADEVEFLYFMGGGFYPPKAGMQ